MTDYIDNKHIYHKNYHTYKKIWNKIRICYAGQDSVHGAGELLLPKLSGSDTEADRKYESYKNRTLFLNAIGKTVEIFMGMIFRKQPIQTEDLKEDVLQTLKSVTNEEEPLFDFLLSVTEEALLIGRVGLFVDHPPIGEAQTQAEVEALGLQAVISFYTAENITKWGKNFYILKEVYDEKISEFESTEKERLRVLDLDSTGDYRQRTYLKSKKKDSEEIIWVFENQIYPMINGEKLTYIPFWMINSKNTKNKVEKPTLSDLMHINIQHYQVYADFRHGVHMTGFPQAVITGFQNREKETFTIGSGTVWTFPDPNTEAKYLEYEGLGLQYPRELLDNLYNMMATFGARMLMEEKQGAESAKKAEIDRSGEASSVSLISNIVSHQISEAVKTLLQWRKISDTENYSIQLNKDYLSLTMESSTLKELIDAVFKGAMSFDTFYYNIQKGELAIPGRSAEEERSKIDLEQDNISV